MSGRRTAFTSIIILLTALSLLAVSTGCSIVGENREIKLLEIKRGKSVDGKKAKNKDDDIIIIKFESTNKEANKKIDELDRDGDFHANFKLQQKDKTVSNKETEYSVKVDKSGNKSIITISFTVPEDIKDDLFLLIDGIGKIPLDAFDKK